MFDWLKRKAKKAPLNLAVLRDQKKNDLRTFVVSEDTPVQTRRAQAISPPYEEAIRLACRCESGVFAAYVLDMRQPGREGQWLLIELALDDPKRMPEIAENFATALKSFADWKLTLLRLADVETMERMKGTEFYLRR